jgi:hypothetical protein
MATQSFRTPVIRSVKVKDLEVLSKIRPKDYVQRNGRPDKWRGKPPYYQKARSHVAIQVTQDIHNLRLRKIARLKLTVAEVLRVQEQEKI